MDKLGRSFAVVLWAGLLFMFAPVFAADGDKPADPSDAALVRVQSVEVIASPVGPVVVLKIGSKSVPVFVETLVAHSIQAALAGLSPPRPLSHDLMHTILESLDAKVSQVVIRLRDGTFYGSLTIETGGTPKVFDSRSSDAIALAIRFKAPILVDKALIDEAGVEAPQPRVNAV
jgi:bifunctional DNase/RNase